MCERNHCNMSMLTIAWLYLENGAHVSATSIESFNWLIVFTRKTQTRVQISYLNSQQCVLDLNNNKSNDWIFSDLVDKCDQLI